MFLFLIIGSYIGNAQQNKFDRIEKKILNIKSMGGTFHQEYFDSLQGKKSYSSGTFAFMQPALMKWQYQEPEELLIIIGKEKLWMFDPILENVTIKKVDAITDYSTLASLFKPDQLRHHFKEIQPKKRILDTDPDIMAFYLAPKKPNPNAVEIQVGFDRKKFYIRQFVIFDANQNYRKISFSELSLNPDYRESDFQFAVTEDMEVIEDIAR